MPSISAEGGGSEKTVSQMQVEQTQVPTKRRDTHGSRSIRGVFQKRAQQCRRRPGHAARHCKLCARKRLAGAPERIYRCAARCFAKEEEEKVVVVVEEEEEEEQEQEQERRKEGRKEGRRGKERQDEQKALRWRCPFYVYFSFLLCNMFLLSCSFSPHLFLFFFFYLFYFVCVNLLPWH